MLSHSSSNTNAGHLRRTQSTQSIQRRLSAHSLIDPVAAKQHALVAATLAYERAHGKENFARQQHEFQPPQQLSRRRSRRASGFEGEGSHFKENSSPRRRSSKKVPNAANASGFNTRSRRGTMSSNADVVDYAGTALARMPSVDTVQELGFKQHRSSISVHKLRKAKSMCTPLDHARATSIDDISFGPPPYPPPLPPPLEETVTSIEGLDVEETVDIAPAPMALTRTNLINVPQKPTVSHLPSSEEREAHAQKMRHRASFMLTPFKKRKDKFPPTTPPPGTMSNANTTFTNAVRSSGIHHEATPRFNRSRCNNETKKTGSITARIRSVFRRPSATVQDLPVQQVNASRAYFGGQTNTSGLSHRDNTLQPPTRSSSYNLNRTNSPAHSDVTATSKSRVTSWADSTIAGTTIEDNMLAAIEEECQPRYLSSQKDHKHSSFNVFRRMRRASRGDMKTPSSIDQESEPSASRQEHRSKSRLSRDHSRRASAAWENLPSQIQKTTTITRKTVRAVSADDEQQATLRSVSASSSLSMDIRIPDPFSSENKSTMQGHRNMQNLQSVVEKAPTPTADQIASRVQRSNERWQEPLEEGRSLFFPRSPNSVSPERHSRQVLKKDYGQSARHSSPEDVFAAIREPPSSRSMDVISPSIYSEDEIAQETIHELSALPRTPMLVDGSGSAVIITNRNVARYSVGSPKKPEPVQPRRASKDWRTWLQSEVQDLSAPPPEDIKLKPDWVEPAPGSDHHREGSEHDGEPVLIDATRVPTVDLEDLEASFALPSIEWRPNQPPKLTQHASESSVPSSNDSIRSHLQSHFSVSEEAEDMLGSDRSLASDGHRHSSKSRPRKMPSRLGQEDRPSSRLQDIHENRPALADRPSSRMNERFPFIDTSRPPSRVSRRSSTPAQSLHSFSSRPTMVQRIQSQSASEKNKENSTPSPTQSLPVKPTRPRPVIRRPMSTLALQRSQSSLAQYTTNDSAIISTPTSTSSQKLTSHIPRPIHVSPKPRSRDTFLKQNGKYTSLPAIETDNTLVNIIKGPYRESASPRPLSIRKVTAFSRENSPLKENTPVTSRAEAPVTPTSGQRLAEQFLNARRFREEMRVMSPGEGSPMTNVSGSEFSPAFL